MRNKQRTFRCKAYHPTRHGANNRSLLGADHTYQIKEGEHPSNSMIDRFREIFGYASSRRNGAPNEICRRFRSIKPLICECSSRSSYLRMPCRVSVYVCVCIQHLVSWRGEGRNEIKGKPMFTFDWARCAWLQLLKTFSYHSIVLQLFHPRRTERRDLACWCDRVSTTRDL